jgi:hypothetical protein
MRILRLLSTRPLPCGCLVGVYETFAGPVVWVLETPAEACQDPKHRPGAQLEPEHPTELTPLPGRLPDHAG